MLRTIVVFASESRHVQRDNIFSLKDNRHVVGKVNKDIVELAIMTIWGKKVIIYYPVFLPNSFIPTSSLKILSKANIMENRLPKMCERKPHIGDTYTISEAYVKYGK